MIKLNPIDAGPIDNGKSRYNSNVRHRDQSNDIMLPQIKERRPSNLDGRGYSHAQMEGPKLRLQGRYGGTPLGT
jgi:hypothetical protein